MSENCDHLGMHLDALVDGQLPEAHRRPLASHVLLCPECAREVGQLVAHKALLARPASVAQPPQQLWARVLAELDRADGVRRALGPVPAWRPARLPKLVAAGALLIICALLVRFFLTAAPAAGDQFFVAHHQALELSGRHAAAPGYLQAIGISYAHLPLSLVWQAIDKMGNTFALHRLYLAGRLPVSVITLPTEAVPLNSLQRRVVRGKVRFVASDPRGSLVAVLGPGMTHVLVAHTRVEDLLPLADQLAAEVTRTL
jgi:anti-sigma factor RsiW